jgi:chemotaxis protein MotA
MFVAIGALMVLGCVFGSFIAMGGNIAVLWQPFEFIIILGAATGALIIGNPASVLKGIGSSLGLVAKGAPYSEKSYLELLSMLFALFKLAKSKGNLALEQHIENPKESTLFNQFPGFARNHHAVEFVCDYVRLMTLGTENVHEMEALMDEDLETHHHERDQITSAIQNMADGTPALGIVAAVLGVIKTMGSITDPPEVLGHHIGGALVGTFLGVLVAYGFLGPLAAAMKATFAAEATYMQCIKAALLAHLAGHAPAVSVEFARKALTSDVRPSFQDVEGATAKVVPV